MTTSLRWCQIVQFVLSKILLWVGWEVHSWGNFLDIDSADFDVSISVIGSVRESHNITRMISPPLGWWTHIACQFIEYKPNHQRENTFGFCPFLPPFSLMSHIHTMYQGHGGSMGWVFWAGVMITWLGIGISHFFIIKLQCHLYFTWSRFEVA